MKRFGLLFALAAAALLSGCGGEGAPAVAAEPPPDPAAEVTDAPVVRRTELTLPWQPAEGMDPFGGNSRVNETVLPLLYEGLFALDARFAPRNVLCASYTVSEDGLVYALTLRDPVYFSDGSLLSADDVVYSLRQAMAEGSNYAARLSGIASVAARDDRTVAVTLTRPNRRLPALLDLPIVCAASAAAGENPAAGTGPFAPERRDGGMVLTARRDWWQNKTLPVQTVFLHETEKTDELLNAFQMGRLSLVAADPTEANAVGYTGNFEIRNCPSAAMVYLGCNTAAPSLLSDGALRAALARGIDRSLIATHLYAGLARAAALPVPPGTAGYDAALADTLAFSKEALRTALAEAGWTETGEDGVLRRRTGRTLTPLELKLVVCVESTYKVAAANQIAQTLREAGVGITVEKLFYDEYLTVLREGSFDLFLGETILPPDFDPSALVATGGLLNYSRWHDPRTDALLSEAGRMGYADLYALLAEEAPILPILFKDTVVMTRRDLISGASPTWRNAFYNMEDWIMAPVEQDVTP